MTQDFWVPKKTPRIWSSSQFWIMLGVKKFDTKKRHGQTNVGWFWFVIQAKAKKKHQLAFSTLGFGVKHPLKTPQREEFSDFTGRWGLIEDSRLSPSPKRLEDLEILVHLNLRLGRETFKELIDTNKLLIIEMILKINKPLVLRH